MSSLIRVIISTWSRISRRSDAAKLSLNRHLTDSLNASNPSSSDIRPLCYTLQEGRLSFSAASVLFRGSDPKLALEAARVRTSIHCMKDSCSIRRMHAGRVPNHALRIPIPSWHATCMSPHHATNRPPQRPHVPPSATKPQVACWPSRQLMNRSSDPCFLLCSRPHRRERRSRVKPAVLVPHRGGRFEGLRNDEGGLTRGV